jgi:alanine racemase
VGLPLQNCPEPVARINLTALAQNAESLLAKVEPCGLLAVVKWNAYGHGLIPCAKALDIAGAIGFGVSSTKEGIELRKSGISKRILVMTDWVGKPLRHFLDWNLEAAVTSWYKVEYIESASRKLGRSIPAHIKFDTGLGRVGIPHQDADQALPAIARMSALKVVALYSHLGYSGPQDRVRGEKQIAVFRKILAQAKKLGIEPEWVHLANSAAALAIPDVPGNLVRTGIALYGQPPSRAVADLIPLEPVMTIVGHVRASRRLRRGQGFPTPHFWQAPYDGWGAEVALGFGAQYPRSLVGKAKVLFRGKHRPLVGVMNRDTSYVFTGSDQPEIGEEVVFWGRQGNETLYLHELAPLIDALPYELPTWLSNKIPRDYGQNKNERTTDRAISQT